MKFIKYIMLVITVLILYLVMPFFNTLFTAFLLSFLTFPLFSKINKRLKNEKLSAFLLTLFSIAFFTLFSYLFMRMVIISFIQMQAILDNNILLLNDLISSSKGEIFFESNPSNLVDFIGTLFTNTPKLLLDYLLLTFLVFYILKDSDNLKKYVKKTLKKKSYEKLEKFVKRADYVLDNVLWEYFFVGILIGLIVFVSLSFLRVNFALELATISLTMSIFPIISGWMLILVLAFYYHLTMNYFNAFILFLITIPLAFIDYYFQKIFKKEEGINHLMLVLGLVSGVLSMGLFGFIAGPILAGIIQAGYETYVKQK